MFVCFEGIDGAGKTTQAQILVQRLKQDGVAAELVADPGTTKIGTAIRQILLHNDAPISVMAQMLLFSAARAELANYILEQQHTGKVIICDRWLLSTLVYQGEINGIDPELILQIFKSTSAIVPDLCVLLDLDPDTATTRVGAPRDRYERRSLDDRKRMRAAYMRFSSHELVASRLHVINALQPVAVTHSEVYELFLSLPFGCASTRKDSCGTNAIA